MDTAEGRGRCTRRFAQNVRKNVKSLLNPEMTVRYTARIAIQSARTKAVKNRVDIMPMRKPLRTPGAFPYMLKKTLQPVTFLLLIISVNFLTSGQAIASGQARETIFYKISPIGVSVYQDMGLVEFRGRKTNLVIFKTQVTGFKDTETIYSDPETRFPLWIERDLLIWLKKEYLTEEYVKDENRLIITKFKNGRKTEEHQFKGSGPIHNAVLLPFSLRKIPDLRIGWSYKIRIPNEFKVKLVSIEDVTVPAGKFKAYHFTSTPHKFEIWLSVDKLRLPVKIKGAGGYPYTLVMKEYIIRREK